MSESTSEKLKQEARKRELERKVEAFRREEVERERMEQVKLIGVIYVEPLASRAPIAEETKIFKEEQKSRELE
jgi:hypothetical protein